MIGLVFIFTGALVAIIGSIGLVRFPDVFTRSHAQTVINVGGVSFMLAGFILENLESVIAWKFLIMIALIFVTSPVATHAITKAAYKDRNRHAG